MALKGYLSHQLLQAGDKFNRLAITSFSHSDKRWRRCYNVKCDCGNFKVIMGSAMISGNTKSCGCLTSELGKLKLLPNNIGIIRQIILGYKRHAIDRGFEFLLSENDVINVISKNCHYCDIPPSNIKRNKHHPGYLYTGIDRINASKNYTVDNIVPCCKICNYAKSNMTIEEFHQWALRIGKKAMANQWG